MADFREIIGGKMALREQVLSAAESYTKTSNPKLRWDQWNWFYKQITTQIGPAPEQFGFHRRANNQEMLDVDPMTVDFWWSKVSSVIAGGSYQAGSGVVTLPGGGSTTVSPGPSAVQPTGPAGTAGGNVFLDTLLMLLSILFAGKTL